MIWNEDLTQKSHFLSFWRWKERKWCWEFGVMGFVQIQ